MRKVTLFLALGFAAVLSLSGCTLTTMFGTQTGSKGSGKEITETREVSGFNDVVLAAVGKLVVTQGGTERLTITGDDNIVALIKSEVRAGKLVIEFERAGLNVNPLSSITYHLTVVNINSLQLSGAGDISATGLKTENLSVSVSGAGSVAVTGEAPTQVVTLSGAGNYRADDLKSESVKVTISGAGNATVWAQKSLDVSISGLGKVSYYGDPAITSHFTGAGTMEAKGDK